MRLLSEIREAKGVNRHDRYEILFDDESMVVLSAREISDLTLREGASINADLHSRIVVAGQRLAVYDRAVGMLARGAKSMFDLRRRLMAKGESRDAVKWALAKLEDDGIASDESFAVQFSRARFRRGASRSAVLTALLRVAVARDIAEDAIARVIAEEQWDEGSASQSAAAKKIRALRGLDRAVAKRRLVGFLRRRGFSAGVVKDALAKLNTDDTGAG